MLFIYLMKIGIIGLGVGERHIVGYQKVPGCSIKSVCDIDEKKLKEVADRNGISERYCDYRKITDDPEIDVVSICSYDDVHTEQAVSALENGKHVMIEKPVAVNDEQADLLVAAHRNSSSMLTSNLILRCCPRFRFIKEEIDSGNIGKLFYMEGDYIHAVPQKITEGWRGKISFYSPILGGGVHMIDLIRWYADEEVESVCAMGSNKETRHTGYPFDDTNVLLLKFPSGLLAKVLVSLTPKHPKFHALKVFGNRATFENRLENGIIFKSDEFTSKEIVNSPYPGMEKGDLLPNFISAVRNASNLMVSPLDVFNVMDVCLAAQKSRRTNQFVDVNYRYAKG